MNIITVNVKRLCETERVELSVWDSDSVNAEIAYSFPGSQGDQSSAQFTSQWTLPPAQVHTDDTSHPVANQASHAYASNANPVPYMLQRSR